MESKVTQQKEIADDIHNLYRNMKKDPIARKTLEYFDERRKTLQHLHGKFCKNDEELRGKLPADHKYIVDKFRTQVDELYQDAENYITKKIQALKNPSPTDPEPTTEAVRKQQLQIKQFEQQLRTTKERILRNNNQSFLAKRLDELTSMWKDISKTHVDIQLKDGTDIENYLRSEIYEQAYEDYLDTEEILTHNPEDVAATNQSKTANLPSLQIPTFNGEYEQWPTFRDLFHQIVHKQNIADVEKMQFLKTHVRGEAGKLIQHLETSETNYNTAWSLIEERFNNQRLLFTKHLDHILNIPASNNDSSYGIKKIHDVTVESLSAIKNMNIDVDAAGPIIGHIILKKMDPESKKLYEMALEDPKQIQDLDSILAFLKKRFQSLETLKGQSKKADSDRNIKSPDTKKQWTYPSYHSQSTTCPSCSEEHRIVACKKFLAMDVNERWSLVCKKNLCRSCLTHGRNRTCKNRSRCPKCDRSHNILLHKDTAIPINNPAPTNNEINKKNTQTIAGHVGSSNQINRQEKIAMLATAYVDVLTNDGQHKTLRSLIDPGSHKSFITESAAQLLGLPRYKHHVEITGLGVAAAGTSKWKIFTQLRPRFSSSHAHNAELLVMPKLTKNIPSININVQIPDEWNNLMFADPNFNTTAPIDILIGVDLYGEILESGLKKTTTGLILQKTTFGWIISGNAPLSVQQPEILGLIASIDIDIDEKLTKFWEIEEVQSTPNSTDDVEYSEKFYNDTHGRLPGGRYEVRLPFKNDASDLGESRRKAVARFLQLEKRFRNDKQLESDYKQFMRQYIELDHMEAVTPIGQGQPYDSHCFIPHQYVLKEGKPIRVVFDASSKTTSGLSLNDVLHTGPKLQRDLLDILLQWRVFEVALTADIEKMYRQIIISKEDRQFHRIIWRFSENEPLGEYELKTVTYGTAPAAYLAIRTLLQLAHDEYASHPLAAEIVKKNFYVDDLLISAPNQEEARLIQQETTALLKKGGFNLRKWNSNLRVLNEVNKVHDFGEKGDNSTVKALGIIWNPNTDSFQYKMHLATATATSKRKILSEISTIFDPLGLLSPIIIRAKMLMQDIWKQNYTWDEELPSNIVEFWKNFKNELSSIESISIPRWLHYKPNSMMEIHGYIHEIHDASLKGYGCAIYIKIIDEAGKTHITLLMSKSKVTPVKNTTTLPRLELCAALLLAKTTTRAVAALSLTKVPIFAWTDSTITLSWIKGNPSRWKSFVANRVQEIHKHIRPENWYHVRSENNPADLVSRGVTPSQLKHSRLWWNGPESLQQRTENIIQEAQRMAIPETISEIKRDSHLVLHTTENDGFDLVQRYSEWGKMKRIAAYCLRFINNARKSDARYENFITSAELHRSEIALLKIIQRIYYSTEKTDLDRHKEVSTKSTLRSLNPFMDEEGVLRVGGRLHNSNLSFNERHPIIIPPKAHITELIIRDAHARTLHGGNQLTTAYIRQKYWIVQARSKIRQIIHKCITCARQKASTQKQQMGILPPARVTPSHPFTNTGIDYAGPIPIRMSKGRGAKSYKGYIALFICLATKAIHLEVVSDLTKEAFLAAFRRFTARRGLCKHIYSDNGTTFVGAKNSIDKNFKKAISEETFSGSLAKEFNTEWHWIPPFSPHFGGLWESGVRSTKHHLKRVIGDTTLTFEEMTTLLCQIEACLNSRPLLPLEGRPQDTNLLTPGHFLIGQPLISPPDDHDVSENKVSTLKRWKLIQKMKNDFWKTWTGEYLTRLQQRTKWQNVATNIKVGDIVLLKQENIDPNKWPLAKITEVHPGSDGLVRVITARTEKSKDVKRPITKICKLPIENEETINPGPDTQTKGKPSSSKQSIPSPRTLTTMITACLTLLLISTPAKANFTIKSLNPGLYIEHLGSAYIDGGTFRLDFNISWAQIHQDEKNVNLTATRYKELCSRALEHTEDAHCNELVHHLNEMTGEILLHIGNIRDFTRNRFKRGLFGQFMTSVFGVNDEVYHQIDGLQENQQHLIDTTRHQSKLLVSAVTSMEKSEKRIMKKLEHFQYKINQGLSLMHDLHAWYRTVDKQKIMIQIVLNFQLANNYLQEVLQKYKKIAEVCYYNGHLGEFFTPDEIHHITQEANSKLPSTMSILNRPIREMKVVREKECLKIYAFLFIIDRHRFELIKATPVPQKRSNGIFTTLSIQNPYMAIEYNIQKYFEISKDDMSHEVEIGPHLYIFGPRLVRDMERHPNCITDQIYNTTSNPKCVYTTQIIEDITWSPLHDSSCLLFTTNKIKTTAIVCSGQRHPITLQNSGIVKLSHDCIIGVNGISIQTKLDASKSIQHSYELPSPLNWNELVLNDTSTSRSIHSPMFNDETNLQDLSKVGREAEEEEDGLSTYSWRKHYGHMTVLSLFSIAITAALIAIGIYIWKNWNKWRNTSHDANPHDAALDEFTLQPLRCRSAGSENKDSEYSESVARDNV